MVGTATFVAILLLIPIVSDRIRIQGRRLQRNASWNGSRLIVVAAAQNLTTFLLVFTVSTLLAQSRSLRTRTRRSSLKTVQGSDDGICHLRLFVSGPMKKCSLRKLKSRAEPSTMISASQ